MTSIKVSVLLGVVLDIAKQFPQGRYTKPCGSYNCCNCRGVVQDGPDTPGCIVGQALQKLGIIIDMGGVENLREIGLIEVDSRAAFEFLSEIQFRQDGGDRWEKAVTLALGDMFVS